MALTQRFTNLREIVLVSNALECFTVTIAQNPDGITDKIGLMQPITEQALVRRGLLPTIGRHTPRWG